MGHGRKTMPYLFAFRGGDATQMMPAVTSQERCGAIAKTCPQNAKKKGGVEMQMKPGKVRSKRKRKPNSTTGSVRSRYHKVHKKFRKSSDKAKERGSFPSLLCHKQFIKPQIEVDSNNKCEQSRFRCNIEDYSTNVAKSHQLSFCRFFFEKHILWLARKALAITLSANFKHHKRSKL